MTDDATCDRFEREGLLRLEQELPLDPHFDSCPACREARAAYQRLGAEIAAAAADHEPPPYWQTRVWARIESRAARRRRRRWFLWLAPPAAAVMAIALRIGMLAPGVGLEVTVEPGDSVRRGVAAQPGDRLVLEAHTDGAPNAELRLYRADRELVLRCSTAAPCERRGDHLRASIVLPAIGSYQPLLLLSREPLPAPTSAGLDRDAEAALATGARVELGDEIRVE